MSAFVLRPEAETDLREIRTHIASDNAERAHRVILRLLDRCRILNRTPYAGRARPDLGEGLRSLVERPYLILYRLAADETAEIVAFVHGARDLPSVIAERSEKG